MSRNLVHKSNKFLIAILIASTFVSCATSPTGRKQLILVSDQQMNQMGLQSFSEIKRKTPIETDYKINNYVKCVANSITRVAKDDSGVKQWEVVVFKDNSANAFALPGGKIGVHTGILKVATSQDQLAAILGHEVGHVIARHGAERTSQSLAQAGILSVVDAMADKSSDTHQIIMASLGLGAQIGILLPFSRKHESEADLIGLSLMARAGFHPSESVELWKNMARNSSGAPPEFLSTHPSNSSRISNLQKHVPEVMGLYSQAQSQGVSPRCNN